MFVGLMVMSTGATAAIGWVGGIGMATYLIGLMNFGLYLRQVLTTPSRRKIPTAAFHLVAAIVWALTTVIALIVIIAREDWGAARDFVVVGGAVGFALQALMGAWSFLLPSTRPAMPARRRVELVAMDVGGRVQVVAYNAGLVLALAGLRSGTKLSLAGICLAWVAIAWVLTKTWCFPLLSNPPSVQRRSAVWWADPERQST